MDQPEFAQGLENALLFKKTRLMAVVEEEFAQPGESIGKLLARLYVDEKKSLSEIGRDLDMSKFTAISWMRQLNPYIAIRSYTEWRQEINNARRETLLGLVDVEGLTIRDIARISGRKPWTVWFWLRRDNIKYQRGRNDPARETLEARREMIKRAISEGKFAYLTRVEQRTLRNLYLLEAKFPTKAEVARRFKIEREAVRQAEKKALSKLERLAKGESLKLMEKGRIDMALGKDPRKRLRELYVEQRLSAEQIALRIRCDPRSVRSRLRNWRIRRVEELPY